jgi:hypothetical protein
MLRRLLLLLAVLPTTGLAACGGGGDDGSSTPTAAPPPATTAVAAPEPPPLARESPGKGELVFTGATSPTTFSGVVLDGAYTVRFEQHAPEDPTMDFSKQTPFTARLRPEGSTSTGLELFRTARASGRRTLTRRGRYTLEVAFGDFPYAVRFTPR